MSSETPVHVENGANEIERKVKLHLGQEKKQYTSTFKMKYLGLSAHPNAYTQSINHLEEQGVIEKTGTRPSTSSTTWFYHGPEGTDTL